MEIVLLGTGAATPTLHRRPTSTAVILNGEISLFDCGEGTQLQLLKAKLRPGKLARIFISHLHGDHFNGLIGLLTSLQLGGREKVLHLYGPEGTKDYLAFMQNLTGFRFDYILAVSEFDGAAEEIIWEFDACTVTARPLQHRIFTAGFRFEEKPGLGKFDSEKAAKLGIPPGPLRSHLQNGKSIELPDGRRIEPVEVVGPPRPGKKVAICLDTQPCENAVKLARDVDLLIHEGTFEHARVKLAGETGHSTVVQAAEIAKNAGVQRLIITHISARYREEEAVALAEQACAVFTRAVIGRDLMRIVV